MNKINITTLGCPKNVVDSGHLVRRFVSEGFVQVDEANDADILLVNTCGFIKDAKEESIEEILRLAKIKKDQGYPQKSETLLPQKVKDFLGTPFGGPQSRGQEKKLIVFGCLAQRYREELLKEIPEIDSIWGVGEEDKIIEYCKEMAIGDRQKAIGDIKIPLAYRPLPIASSYAYLKIAEGCDKKCTFCVIPSIRGRFRSIHPEKILQEAEEYIKNGVKELILVAQDITNYGKELNGYNLVSLLKDLASIRGDFRIRLLYLYPTEISDDLLELISKEDKIQKYLDIPLQHSEDKILRAMGRRGTRKEYIKLIRNIRRSIPGVVLRTTFIVGFPGETEEDFQGLVDFIEEIRFDRLGVFKYSKEEGTTASKIKGHVSEKVKSRRFDEIMIRQAAISLEKNRELIGRKFEAIIDEIDGDIAIARLYSHAPEIDGVVIIEQSAVRNQKSEVRVGDFVNVEIVDAFDYDLKGILHPT